VSIRLSSLGRRMSSKIIKCHRSWILRISAYLGAVHTVADQGNLLPAVARHTGPVAAGRTDPAEGTDQEVEHRTGLVLGEEHRTARQEEEHRTDPGEADHTDHLEAARHTGREEVGRNLAAEHYRTGREVRRIHQERD
jgi:hypothetical protein